MNNDAVELQSISSRCYFGLQAKPGLLIKCERGDGVVPGDRMHIAYIHPEQRIKRGSRCHKESSDARPVYTGTRDSSTH